MRSRLSRVIVLTLLLAVWMASTLGLVHATLHVPGDRTWAVERQGPAVAANHVQGAHKAHEARGPGQRHGWVRALFDDRTDAECRLYDQLSHGASVPGVPLVVLPLVLPAADFAFFQGEVLARWVALFRARGPPSPR